ncbi:MAG: beta-ketoacyl-[acyl-carrier-protein] synthase family protein [Candidatus Omnitrophota bacterium]|jgi:3-oxoacyl-[acyl-carrier-protein] synthase II|nr:MAG: beta-ketoacyl-[acyl-carrier-protein] synthase family protein [Candidatus Omnitrophota bacterium]
MNKRIVISGIGIISPLGTNKDEFWRALRNGVSGFKAEGHVSGRFGARKAALIRNETIKPMFKGGQLAPNRCSNLAYLAARMALVDSGLTIDEKNTDLFGVCTASTLSNLSCLAKLTRQALKGGMRDLDPTLLPHSLLNSTSSYISIKLNIQGFNTTISNGQTSSLDAIDYAANLIKLDRVACVIVIGVEEVAKVVLDAFSSEGMLAGNNGRQICCPFDKRRNGLVLGEGAIGLVIEDIQHAFSREAKIYAEILGYGNYFSCLKGSRFSGVQKSMAKSIEKSRLDIRQIDYISAAANSDQFLDLSETIAVKKLFGSNAKRIPVSAIKSMIGETISAAGLFQVVSAIGMMHNNFVAPTINYRVRDPGCDLEYIPNKSIVKKINTALINNIGFTGSSSTLIISKPQPN